MAFPGEMGVSHGDFIGAVSPGALTEIEPLMPVDHEASALPPLKKTRSRLPPVARFALAGTVAVGAAAALVFDEARAEEPGPRYPKTLTGVIDPNTKVDFILTDATSVTYAAMPKTLSRFSNGDSFWVRQAVKNGGIVNGVINALKQFNATIVGLPAQCADVIAQLNASSFEQSKGHSSGWLMNTRESPVKVPLGPTVVINGVSETNYCAVNNPDSLRVSPNKPVTVTATYPAPKKDVDPREHTKSGMALLLVISGLGGLAWWWNRRRNKLNDSSPSLVPAKPIEYTHKLSSSYSSSTEREETEEEREVDKAFNQWFSEQIKRGADAFGTATVFVGDVRNAIRDRLKNRRPAPPPPPPKPGR